MGKTAMKSRHISRLEKSVNAGSLCVLTTLVFGVWYLMILCIFFSISVLSASDLDSSLCPVLIVQTDGWRMISKSEMVTGEGGES